MIRKYSWLILSITLSLGLLIYFNLGNHTAGNDSDPVKIKSSALPVSKSASAVSIPTTIEKSIVNMDAQVKSVAAQKLKVDKPHVTAKTSQPVSKSPNNNILNNTKGAEVKSVAAQNVKVDKPPVTVKTSRPVAQPINNNISNSTPVSRGQTSTDINKYPKLSKVKGIFGQFHYRELSGGRIEVDPQWVVDNIVTITLPGTNKKVQVHKLAADNFIMAFNYINNGTVIVNGKQVSLLSLIETMDGTYVTRHVNWAPDKGLSNHSWGTAIDINARDHFRYVDSASDPNLILWEKAFKPAGFSWGNSYNDSMHYELIK